PMFRLAGRTLGLVGFGNIGRAGAVRAAAFGLRVLYADPLVPAGRFPVPGEERELAGPLGGADFVSLAPALRRRARGQSDGPAPPGEAEGVPRQLLPGAGRGHRRAGPAAGRGPARRVRARHDGPRAPPRPPPAARARERDADAARGLVQRAGPGGAPGGGAR